MALSRGSAWIYSHIDVCFRNYSAAKLSIFCFFFWLFLRTAVYRSNFWIRRGRSRPYTRTLSVRALMYVFELYYGFLFLLLLLLHHHLFLLLVLILLVPLILIFFNFYLFIMYLCVLLTHYGYFMFLFGYFVRWSKYYIWCIYAFTSRLMSSKFASENWNSTLTT